MQVKMMVTVQAYMYLCLRDVSLNGMVKLGMKVNGEFWMKHICSRIREVGKQV